MTRPVKPEKTPILNYGSRTPFSPFSVSSLIKFLQYNLRSPVMRSDNSTHNLRYMKIKKAVAVTIFTILSSPVQAADDETGVWIDHTGRGAVEIAPCGRALCGRIVWLKEPNDKYGRPLTDGNNPNAAQRKRPICGLPILGNLQPQSDGAWDAGWVYDPNDGSTHDAQIELVGPNKLVLTGYAGVKLFSKSFTWVRAPDDIPRCDGTTTTTDAKKPGAAAPAATKKTAVTKSGKAAAHTNTKAPAKKATTTTAVKKQPGPAPKQTAAKPTPRKVTSEELN
jgi:uncharacterized protein (DUF2147 family)